MPFWACARTLLRREQLALHCLAQAGFTTYLPRLRERRFSHGRRLEARPALFPNYLFIRIELQWHSVRWAPGIAALIMDGVGPAKVPDSVIAEIRSREVRGLVELPPRLRRGARVKVRRGPFRDHVGLYAGQAPHERVAVLLTLLGASRRLELAGDAVEAVP